MFANPVGEGIEAEENENTTPTPSTCYNRNHQRVRFRSEMPSSVSRRSAATSMATATASILGSITLAGLPGVAVAADTTASAASDTSTAAAAAAPSATDALPTGTVDASSSSDDPPVAKEKVVEYTVLDFRVALPANWKVITKYDEKGKPPSTPTLFSAIDFNSGAVISVVKEEACSVSDYAKSSFETSKDKTKSKKCDFVLRPSDAEGSTSQGQTQNLFSIETYEKDASKLLIRHDDRDNAVLRGVSRIEESKIMGMGGRRRRPLELSISSPGENGNGAVATAVASDSYVSSLLELTATTTIPTSGTYRDTMGLEQPNTIDRKVLAKSVAITTKVTRTQGVEGVGILPKPSNESTLLAATGTEAKPAPKVTATANEVAPTVTKMEPDPYPISIPKEPIATAESTATTMASTTPPVDSSNGTQPVITVAAPIVTTSTTAEPATGTTTTTSNATTPPISSDSIPEAVDPSSLTAKYSPMATAMAMDATIIEEPIAATATAAANANAGPSADTIRSALGSTDASLSVPSQSAIETTVETAIVKAVERAKDAAIDKAIEAVKEPAIKAARETAKETVQEMFQGATLTSPQKAELEKAVAVASANAPVPSKTLETTKTVALGSGAASAGEPATATPTTTPTTTTTTSTTVLSIWLSAPLDEWQKPVMGTRLKQIWESVEYTDNLVEGGDNLALLDSDSDDEEAVNRQLLLLNKRSLL